MSGTKMLGKSNGTKKNLILKITIMYAITKRHGETNDVLIENQKEH